ncbi:MAG TPA: hypothetical protein VHK67_04885 [Rhabdochlamydiaceae bacterium]|jgi:hypothetical protein|nr:hypothetical protein [Rhabdochlamydiaceae bacterium]
MTSYLSKAQLTPGAACWKALLEIEKEMSHAYVEAMQASEKLMEAQPLFTQATQNSYNAQAKNQLASGLISGGSELLSAGTQVFFSVKGNTEGDKAFNESMEPETLRVTAEEVTQPSARASTAPTSTAAAVVEGNNADSAEPANAATAPGAERSAAQTRDVSENNTSAREDAEEKAKKAEKQKKLGEQKRQTTIQKYQTYAQLVGTGLHGLGTVGSTPFNTFATQNAGLAQAVGNVVQGNQSAQSSYNTLTQTYKDAFTNASQVLAGVVAAQSH